MELDRQFPIVLTEAECQEGAMALQTAQILAAGLVHLNACVRGVEIELAAQLEKENGPGIISLIYGNSPQLRGVPLDLVECAFRWYAVSVCDFVRAIAYIGRFDDDIRSKYSSDVLGAVQAFRDKVGAHTAGLTQNKRDNHAERKFTPCPQVSWNGDRFEVGTFTMRIRSGDKVTDSGSLQPWKLTEYHERLCTRYPMVDLLTHKAD